MDPVLQNDALWCHPVAELHSVYVVKRHHKILMSTIDASYEYSILTQ
jgi:hypothetical protein